MSFISLYCPSRHVGQLFLVFDLARWDGYWSSVMMRCCFLPQVWDATLMYVQIFMFFRLIYWKLSEGITRSTEVGGVGGKWIKKLINEGTVETLISSQVILWYCINQCLLNGLIAISGGYRGQTIFIRYQIHTPPSPLLSNQTQPICRYYDGVVNEWPSTTNTTIISKIFVYQIPGLQFGTSLLILRDRTYL